MALHWLSALLVLSAIALGVYMTSLQVSPAKLKFYNWHKWLGICILGISCARLVWRSIRRPPPDLPMAPWQRAAAHTMHWLMYLLLFAVPVAGWTYSSAAGFPVVLFGVLALPDLVGPDKVLASSLRTLHSGLAIFLGTLIALHVAAVIKHQLLDRDRILSRILPRLGARP